MAAATDTLAATQQGVETTQTAKPCRYCGKLPVAPSVLNSKSLCADCHTLKNLLTRNLGGAPEEWTDADRRAFFARPELAQAKSNGRYQWSLVRAQVKQTSVSRRSQTHSSSLGGPFLPLTVWLARGYTREHVLQFPSETDSLGMTTYQVATKATSVTDVAETVESELRERETEVRAKKTAKADPEGQSLNVPLLQTRTGAGQTEAQTSKKAERAAARAAAQEAKQSAARAQFAAASLAKLQPKVSALEAAVKKAASLTDCSEELRTQLAQALQQFQGWSNNCRSCVAGATVPELGFDSAALKGSLAAVAALLKSLGEEGKAAAAAKRAARASAPALATGPAPKRLRTKSKGR